MIDETIHDITLSQWLIIVLISINFWLALIWGVQWCLA